MTLRESVSLFTRAIVSARQFKPFQNVAGLHQLYLDRAMDNHWNVDNRMAGVTHAESNHVVKIILVVDPYFIAPRRWWFSATMRNVAFYKCAISVSLTQSPH